MGEVLAAGVVLVPSADPRRMERLSPGWLAVGGGRVTAWGEGPPDGPARDLGPGTILAPGFVDLQVNGVGATDLAGAGPGEWAEVRRALAASGVTGFCPTFVTAPLGAYDRMLVAAAAAARADGPADGAAVVGVHLEGPFLGGAPGAHPVDLVRPADPEWLVERLEAHPGLVRLVTLAPEADPDGRCVRMLAASGVVVSLGHSTAPYAEARRAFDAGARMATHLFNGMGPLHHREPGLAGAALDDERVAVGLIADLVHVHPAVLRLVARAKPHAAVVTDSVAVGSAVGSAAEGAGPSGPGPSPVAGSARGGAGALTADPGGSVRLPDGTLAGTSMTMLHAVANLVAAGVAVERAVSMASVVPARIAGLDTFGARGEGGRADLVAFTAPAIPGVEGGVVTPAGADGSGAAATPGPPPAPLGTWIAGVGVGGPPPGPG